MRHGPCEYRAAASPGLQPSARPCIGPSLSHHAGPRSTRRPPAERLPRRHCASVDCAPVHRWLCLAGEGARAVARAASHSRLPPPVVSCHIAAARSPRLAVELPPAVDAFMAVDLTPAQSEASAASTDVVAMQARAASMPWSCLRSECMNHACMQPRWHDCVPGRQRDESLTKCPPADVLATRACCLY